MCLYAMYSALCPRESLFLSTQIRLSRPNTSRRDDGFYFLLPMLRVSVSPPTYHSRSLDIVGKADHADRLPRAESDTGRDTSVETLETVCVVDVGKRVEHGLFRRSSRVLAFDSGLHLVSARSRRQTHLDSDDLDRLVPGRERTTNRRGEDLVHRTELVTFFDPLQASQR